MLDKYISSRITEALDYMQNDTLKSLEIFDEVLEIEPDNIDAVNGKGSSLLKLNRIDEAEECFNQSLEISSNTSALINKGIISKKRKEYESALNYYDRACKINPDLGSIVSILKNEIVKLITDNEEHDLSDEVKSLIEKGFNYKNDNKLWDALECFNQAIALDSRCKDKLSSFIDEINTTLQNELLCEEISYNNESKMNRLKNMAIKAQKQNNFKKALTLTNVILEIENDNINFLNRKGMILFDLNEYEGSIECFDSCLNIDSCYCYSLFNKAFVLRNMEKFEESLTCFDELLKTPNHPKKAAKYILEIQRKI